MDVAATVEGIDVRLRALADPTRAHAEKAYLKSQLVFYGTGLPAVRTIANGLGRPGALSAGDLRALAQALWATGIHEHRAMTVVLLERHARSLAIGDLDWLIALVRASHTWAYVDSLAANTIGVILGAAPDAATYVRTWAKDDDFWVRRTGLLALLVPLRRGQGDPDLFAELAVPMLQEKEFFIRKAIGWVLRETAKHRPAWVRTFVDQHGAAMAGLTRREAEKGLRRMPS